MVKRFVVFVTALALPCLTVTSSASAASAEQRRLAREIEQLVEEYGNPDSRGEGEYIGVSIDPTNGNVSHIYEDLITYRRTGMRFKDNQLFNLKDVDPTQIRAYDNKRWWTVTAGIKEGEKIVVHSNRWSSEKKKNEDSWWPSDTVRHFCGVKDEEQAYRIANKLKRLVQLYQ